MTKVDEKPPDLSWWRDDEHITEDVYDYIRSELAKVKSLPAAERKKLVHKIWCNNLKCGASGRSSSSRRQLVAEIVRIGLAGGECDVIRFRQRQKLPLGLPDPEGLLPGEHGRLAARAAAARKQSRRLGEWQFYLVLDDADESLLHLDCECMERIWRIADIMTQRREGGESTVEGRHADPR